MKKHNFFSFLITTFLLLASQEAMAATQIVNISDIVILVDTLIIIASSTVLIADSSQQFTFTKEFIIISIISFVLSLGFFGLMWVFAIFSDVSIFT